MLRKDRTQSLPLTNPAPAVDPIGLVGGALLQSLRPMIEEITGRLIRLLLVVGFGSAIIGGLLTAGVFALVRGLQ